MAWNFVNLFLDEKKQKKGIHLSLENFTEFEKVDVYPLYAIGLLRNHI